MKKSILVTMIIFSFIGCGQKSNKLNENVYSPDSIFSLMPHKDKDRLNALLDSALINGNDKAFNEVASYQRITGHSTDIFYHAFIMANKHNNAEAYFYVYNIIIEDSPEDPKEALNELDSRTRNFALYHLLKSYEMGEESAEYEIKNIFGKNAVIPKSSYYLKEYAKE